MPRLRIVLYKCWFVVGEVPVRGAVDAQKKIPRRGAEETEKNCI